MAHALRSLGPSRLATRLTALLALAAAAEAQTLGVAFVADTSHDTIWRLEDLDDDGDYDDAGEVGAFYAGAVALGDTTGVTVADDGAVYVCDSTLSMVLRLEDLNGDGDAVDLDEPRLFFNGMPGGNPSGIETPSLRNIVAAPGGVVYLACSNTSSGGIDRILCLRDLNQDGDANDAFEATTYFQSLPGAMDADDSVVQDVLLGRDGNLYYLEAGSTGALAKGVYRLVDRNGSGDIDAASEIDPFFLPPSLGGLIVLWQFSQAQDGTFYVSDTGNDVIWRFRDDDASGDIDVPTEAGVLWTGQLSLVWAVFAYADGTLYACQSQSPDRLLRLRDLDGDGVIDPDTEVEEVFDESVSPASFGEPRDLWVVAPLDSGTPFCFGDAPVPGCPCGNVGAADGGCQNSVGSGATLTANGFDLVGDDAVVLEATGCPPNRSGVFFQGTLELATGQLFGDGLRCVGGPVLRLELTTTDGAGAAQSTVGLAAAAGLQPGDRRSYQFWYRDPVGAPCGTGFNTTNGFTIDWH